MSRRVLGIAHIERKSWSSVMIVTTLRRRAPAAAGTARALPRAAAR